MEGADAVAKGVEGGLGAAAEVQLGQDVPDVGAHGGLANGQPEGYLQDAVSLGHEAEDLDLPVDREPYSVGRDEAPESDRTFALRRRSGAGTQHGGLALSGWKRALSS